MFCCVESIVSVSSTSLQAAPAVELSGRISQLTRDDGLPIWVNLANVLYVESIKPVD
jgi:hypothetical protein